MVIFFIAFIPKHLPHHHHSLKVIPIHILLRVPIFVVIKHHVLMPLLDSAIEVRLLMIWNAHVLFANGYKPSQVELPGCDFLDILPLDYSFFLQYLSFVVAIGSFLGLGFWGWEGKRLVWRCNGFKDWRNIASRLLVGLIWIHYCFFFFF